MTYSLKYKLSEFYEMWGLFLRFYEVQICNIPLTLEFLPNSSCKGS